MTVRLTFFDGARCIGGNKILLEADDTTLSLDFGMNFGASGVYFDEFLTQRNGRGTLDLLELGLLPPLKGIYRPDLELPAQSWWGRNAGCTTRLDGVLLSHAHVDHSGYISYLSSDTPILASPVTAAIAKAMQDTSASSAATEVCYITPRELGDDGLLKTPSWRTVPHQQRPFVLLGQPDQGFEEFWGRPPGARELVSTPLEIHHHDVRVGNLRVRRFDVDHSIPGASAFAIETSEGWIVYTGDLRLHGMNAGATRAFFQAAAALEPIALITEGTHPKTERPVSEQDVYQNADQAVAQAQGLVIADFGPRNIVRLLSFLAIAKQSGRRLAVTTKDAYLLEALKAAGEPGVPVVAADPDLVVYTKARNTQSTWERALIERIGGSVVDASDVAADQDGYILCFSYYDINELIDIQPKGGMYIYSSSEAFNEEMHIDIDRLRAWVNHFRLRFIGEPPDRDGRGGDRGFHASGHIHGAGIEEMVETIRPEALVVVHTESPDWFMERFGGAGRLMIPEPGNTVELPLGLSGRGVAAV